MSLAELCRIVPKPGAGGGQISLGYVSRIERGWRNVSLHVYLAIAPKHSTSHPGDCSGPDDAQRRVTESGDDVVHVLRPGWNLAPDEVIARLSGG